MKLISGADILALGESMAALKRISEMMDPKRKEAAIRAGCTEANIHLRCTYPECGCKDFPKGVEGAIIAWEHYNLETSK